MDSMTKNKEKIQTLITESMEKIMDIDVLDGLEKNSKDYDKACRELFLELWKLKNQEADEPLSGEKD